MIFLFVQGKRLNDSKKTTKISCLAALCIEWILNLAAFFHLNGGICEELYVLLRHSLEVNFAKSSIKALGWLECRSFVGGNHNRRVLGDISGHFLGSVFDDETSEATFVNYYSHSVD